MTPRRLFGLFALFGVVTYSAVLAFARPPNNNPERLARVNDLYRNYAKAFPDVKSITAEKLLASLDGFVLIDVREPKEQAVSMLPGAITKEAYEADAETYAGKPVVTYCTIGYRSGMYARELTKRGVDVANLEGSLLAWTHAGGPLVRRGEPTRELHVYGRQWDLAAVGYHGVW